MMGDYRVMGNMVMLMGCGREMAGRLLGNLRKGVGQ